MMRIRCSMDWRVFTRKYIIVVEQCCLIFLVSNPVYLFGLLVVLFYGLFAMVRN